MHLPLATLTLQESAQFVRLTASRLDCTLAQARSTRMEVLKTHLRMHGSQNTLRARVKDIVATKVDELLEIDPADHRHLF